MERAMPAHSEEDATIETRGRWLVEQQALKLQLLEEDTCTWQLHSYPTISSDATPTGIGNTTLPVKQLTRVAGVDISFLKGSNEHACASIVVLAYPSMHVLYEAFTYVSLPAPYIAGFLAFREVPALTKLYEDMQHRCPQYTPDVTLVDGNGVLHPQGFGLASHFGVLLGIPTIGVGKTFLHVDGLTKPDVKNLMQTAKDAGERAVRIRGHSGRVWGAALCGPVGVQNPVFVSVGHQISLETSLAIVLACTTKFRIPEPIRQADLRSRAVIREWEQQHGEVDTTLDRFSISDV